MSIVVKAYGKINLFLDCLGKRDDGYHEVKMIMQSVRLHDLIEIKESEKNMVFSDSVYVPSNKNNLAMKAAILLQEKYNIPNVSIKIKKNIPVSAGMAGGSTDAAAVLLGCNALFKLGLDDAKLMDIASEIGSDVPFCVVGGTAIAEGRGEIIRSIESMPKMHVILIPAEYGVSTVSVYKALQPEDINPQEKLFSNMYGAIQAGNGQYIESHMYNVLEKPSFRVDARTKERKQALEDLGIKNVLMSGSGPTLFRLYKSEREAWSDFKKIKTIYPKVYLTSTCSFDLINNRLYFNRGGWNEKLFNHSCSR